MTRKEMIKKAHSSIGKMAVHFNFQGAWCARFIDCLFGDEAIFNGNAVYSCTAQMAYWKSIGCWENGTQGIQAGDIIYYDWDNSGDADHVGIVVGVEGDKITVVEGNFGSASWDNTKVDYRVISHSYAFVRGYAIPDYQGESRLEHKTLYSTDMVNNCYAKVEQIQNMLNVVDNAGISCDGYYGDKTKTAVIAYQKRKGLEVDGIIGKETITALAIDYFNV